ncbi:rod-binding protein [Phyllobacterium leguminum]|uniref:Rod binding protein n=1 Tax=Phyllobacterium leguminum TaxID=314237 RepID=A0A318T1M3_9HYPH|nr:rod-binding protein [Phyllobacterium leguminum]PYE87675.1 rod binding protein [Phyllobacterium leguminum]
MAISPPSDLVLDVANAADPDKYRASVERLRTLAASRMVAGQPAGQAFAVDSASYVLPTPKGAEPNSPYTKFEAFMLQSFVQSMFPDEANAVFGKGIAGEYWKSMMAEAIASKMADAGGIGIARMLEAQGKQSADAGSQVLLHQAERQLIQQQLNNKTNSGADTKEPSDGTQS